MLTKVTAKVKLLKRLGCSQTSRLAGLSASAQAAAASDRPLHHRLSEWESPCYQPANIHGSQTRIKTLIPCCQVTLVVVRRLSGYIER